MNIHLIRVRLPREGVMVHQKNPRIHLRVRVLRRVSELG